MIDVSHIYHIHKMFFRICSYRHLNKCELVNIASRRTLYGVCDILSRRGDIITPQFRIPQSFEEPVSTRFIYEVHEDCYPLRVENYKWFHIENGGILDNSMVYLPTFINKGDMIVYK